MSKKVGRNEVCPLCPSGKKYKKCCIDKVKVISVKTKAGFRLSTQELENAIEVAKRAIIEANLRKPISRS